MSACQKELAVCKLTYSTAAKRAVLLFRWRYPRIPGQRWQTLRAEAPSQSHRARRSSPSGALSSPPPRVVATSRKWGWSSRFAYPSRKDRDVTHLSRRDRKPSRTSAVTFGHDRRLAEEDVYRRSSQPAPPKLLIQGSCGISRLLVPMCGRGAPLPSECRRPSSEKPIPLTHWHPARRVEYRRILLGHHCDQSSHAHIVVSNSVPII